MGSRSERKKKEREQREIEERALANYSDSIEDIELVDDKTDTPLRNERKGVEYQPFHKIAQNNLLKSIKVPSAQICLHCLDYVDLATPDGAVIEYRGPGQTSLYWHAGCFADYIQYCKEHPVAANV